VKTSTFVITLHSCLFVSLILLGCTKSLEKSKDVIQDKEQNRVEQVVKDAIDNQDYRLHGFTGRRVVLPGLESENFSQIKKRCGVKLLSGTGDVLKNNKDREERRKNYQFAVEVNKKLYGLCLDNTAK